MLTSCEGSEVVRGKVQLSDARGDDGDAAKHTQVPVSDPAPVQCKDTQRWRAMDAKKGSDGESLDDRAMGMKIALVDKHTMEACVMCLPEGMSV